MDGYVWMLGVYVIIGQTKGIKQMTKHIFKSGKDQSIQ